MALFRSKPSAHPVTEFWAWWTATGARDFDDAIARGKPTSMAAALSRHLAPIDPGLVWETSVGTHSRHRLTVSANGRPELRPLAERWRRAGPGADAVWEYRSSHEAEGGQSGRLDIDGRSLDLSEVRYDLEIDPSKRRVHVRVQHPEFARMGHDARTTVAFLVLDWTLGEDQVEKWIGEIHGVTEYSSALPTGEGLVAAVAALAAEYPPDKWGLARGTDDGSPFLVMMRVGARWIDFPTFDLHSRIVLGYRAGPDGLPEPGELKRLRGAEDRMTAGAGSVILVAHVSVRGERTFHYYSDGEDQNVTEALASAAAAEGATTSSRRDPGWSHVRQFTG